MTKLTTVLLATLLSPTVAFAPAPNAVTLRQCTLLQMSEESAFVADAVVEEKKEEDLDTFDAVEKMGRGAAKVRLFAIRRMRIVDFEGERHFPSCLDRSAY
jgi:hypothetical protein